MGEKQNNNNNNNNKKIIISKHELNICDLNFIFKNFKFDILIKFGVYS